MLLVQPQKQYLVEHSINNPADATTYYVQVVITDSISGANLATLNLGSGNPYWSYLWITPADTSGTGRQLTIKKTVYTDSAYSQISTIYGVNYDSILLRNIAGGFGQPLGGFTRTPDIGEIKKVVNDAIAAIPPAPVVVPYDDSVITSSIQSLREKIDDAMQAHGVSLTHVESWMADRIQELRDEFVSKIKSIPKAVIPEPKDYEPHFASLGNRIDSLAADTSLYEKIDNVEKNNVSRHTEALAKMEQPVLLKVETKNVKREKPEPAKEELPQVDYKKMTIDKLLALSKEHE